MDFDKTYLFPQREEPARVSGGVPFVETEDFEINKPFVITGGKWIVDQETVEILYHLEDILPNENEYIRNNIDWKTSYQIALETHGEYNGEFETLSSFRKLWPEYPDFIPGFIRRRVNRQSDRAGSNRDLSNTNKVQKVVIRNLETGEDLLLDKKEMRLSRMRRSVFTWANTIKDYLPNLGIGKQYRKVMITLTYKNIEDWKPNQIRDFMKE